MILPFTVGVFPKSEVRLGRLDELVLSSSKNVELIAAPWRENEGGMLLFYTFLSFFGTTLHIYQFYIRILYI